MISDLRHSFRVLLRSPGFTLVTVLTLALGIGANTAIFSVVEAVILRPLPYQDPARIAVVFQTEPELPRAPVTLPDYIDWTEQSRSFEQLAAATEDSAIVTGQGDARRILLAPVTANFLELLGARPKLGRAFAKGEDQTSFWPSPFIQAAARKNPVVILSNHLWGERFGSNPSIVGQKIQLDDQTCDVIGVMQPDFQFPRVWGFEPDALVTIPALKDVGRRGEHMAFVLGRLRPGASMTQAESEMKAISARLEKQYPKTNTDIGAAIVPLQVQSSGYVRAGLLVLFGAAGFVLLIACANIANLFLTRAIVRTREMSVRAALGGSPWRIGRQLLSESAVISVLGGLLGLLLAGWTKDLLLRLAPEGYVPHPESVVLNLNVLLFVAAVSVLTAILCGMVPAWHASRTDVGECLKQGNRTVAGGGRARAYRGVLVASELALALMLLVGAGLMLRSLQSMLAVDPGFKSDGLLTMRLDRPGYKYKTPEQRENIWREVQGRVSELPGVSAVGMTSKLPLKGGNNGGIKIEGRPWSHSFQSPLVEFTSITGDYFRAMGIPLLRGRVLAAADDTRKAKVVVVNEKFAKLFFPNEDPLGKHVGHEDDNPEWYEIVGVVGNTYQWGLRGLLPEMYFTTADRPSGSLFLAVRASRGTETLAAAIRSEVQAVDRDIPIYDVASMADRLSNATLNMRFHTLLLGLFAGLAACLALIGIYGVLSYSVAQRNQEIGIRMALGARPADVSRLVLTEASRLVLAGLVVGLAGAVALTRFLASMVYGVKVLDPPTFAAVGALLAVVAACASLVPARRAARVDPMQVLRLE